MISAEFSTSIALMLALAVQAQPSEPPRHFTNNLGMKFVWIPPGSFLMGSPEDEEGRRYDEVQHEVTLTKGFYLGAHVVTQGEWRAVMGRNPGFFHGEDSRPVERVSWLDCHEFMRKLGEKDGYAYRLPTEAEWEYACRAGTTTPFHFGKTISTEQANFNGQTGPGDDKKGLNRYKTTRGGQFPSNKWGLHDMHGNVWQWCFDLYSDYPRDAVVDPEGPESADVAGLILRLSSPIFAERQAATQTLKALGPPALNVPRRTAMSGPDLESTRRAKELVEALAVHGECRVLRGGSFAVPASQARSAYRGGGMPDARERDIGFRVATWGPGPRFAPPAR